jgi:copper chaperone CopZ
MSRRKYGGKDMESLELRIDGMHCDGCAHTIESLLGREPGIQSVSVSHTTGAGRFLYDASVTDAGHIAKTIEQAGYKVRSKPGSVA